MKLEVRVGRDVNLAVTERYRQFSNALELSRILEQFSFGRAVTKTVLFVALALVIFGLESFVAGGLSRTLHFAGFAGWCGERLGFGMDQFEIVDTHVHFWNPDALEYFWLTSDQPEFLRQAFLPDQLEPERLNAGVKYGVYVQVGHDPRENDWILEITKPHPWIRGIVGWLDLTATDLATQIEQAKKDSRFKGVRHLTHAIEDANWLRRKDVNAGLEILAANDLSLDLVLRPDQLELAFDVIAAHSNLSFILDHMGNPPFTGDYDRWQENFSRLATLPNLVCKISGLLTGFQGATDLELLRETIDFGFKHFRASRLMYGGDYPISALVAPYQRTLEIIRNAIEKLEEDDARGFWFDNAMRIYKLNTFQK